MNILFVVMLVLLVGFIVYDVVLTTDAIEGNTFSELLREYGTRTPFFPWVLAALAGRWFHPSDHLRPLLSNQVAIYVVIVVATTLVVAAGIAYKRLRGSDHFIAPWIVVLAGLTFGALVAPMPVASG